jgi:hypothetical protein
MTPDPSAPLRLSPHVPRFEAPIRTSGVLFGVPCYGGTMHDACAHGLMETRSRFEKLGLGFNIVTIRNESLVQRARHHIVAQFLASSCDRLVFIDADIGFTADQVLRLLAHDRDVIGGMYRKKSAETEEYAANFSPDAAGAVPLDEATGALQALHVATGFLAIKRGVFERMANAYPHLLHRLHNVKPGGPTHAHAFFDCFIDPTTLDYYSEDYAFCMRWRAIGGEVWADPGLVLDHWGTLNLRGDPMAHLLAEPA